MNIEDVKAALTHMSTIELHYTRLSHPIPEVRDLALEALSIAMRNITDENDIDIDFIDMLDGLIRDGLPYSEEGDRAWHQLSVIHHYGGGIHGGAGELLQPIRSIEEVIASGYVCFVCLSPMLMISIDAWLREAEIEVDERILNYCNHRLEVDFDNLDAICATWPIAAVWNEQFRNSYEIVGDCCAEDQVPNTDPEYDQKMQRQHERQDIADEIHQELGELWDYQIIKVLLSKLLGFSEPEVF